MIPERRKTGRLYQDRFVEYENCDKQWAAALGRDLDETKPAILFDDGLTLHIL